MPHPARAILFDLDGTLVDSAPDIADALNLTLARFGRPAADDASVAGWIGHGGRALLQQAFGDPRLAAEAWPVFEAAYLEGCGRRSRVHAGVPAMLGRLRAEGVALAVLTNKERAPALRLLEAVGLLHAFDAVIAGDTLDVAKPHPAVVDHALALLGVARADALLVGDSVTDVRTARAAGIVVRLVRHGYPAGGLAGTDAPDGWIDDLGTLQPELP